MQNPKKLPKIHHLGTITQLCRAISSQLRHVSTIRKRNLLNSSVSPTGPHYLVNFGLLAAEISWHIWALQQISTGFMSWERYVQQKLSMVNSTVYMGVCYLCQLLCVIEFEFIIQSFVGKN